MAGAAPATRARLLERRIRTGPVVRRAHSAVLDRVAAAGWVAVGDAASSVDPLSSDGVARAITSGMAAATAVMRWLDGDAMALEVHGRSIAAGVRRYLAQRASVYRDEPRWTNSVFWRRRHFDSAALFLSPHDMLTLAAPAGLAGPVPGLSDIEMGNLIAQCAEPHSAADIVRQFQSTAPHVSDDEVIFASPTDQLAAHPDRPKPHRSVNPEMGDLRGTALVCGFRASRINSAIWFPARTVEKAVR